MKGSKRKWKKAAVSLLWTTASFPILHLHWSRQGMLQLQWRIWHRSLFSHPLRIEGLIVVHISSPCSGRFFCGRIHKRDIRQACLAVSLVIWISMRAELILLNYYNACFFCYQANLLIAARKTAADRVCSESAPQITKGKGPASVFTGAGPSYVQGLPTAALRGVQASSRAGISALCSKRTVLSSVDTMRTVSVPPAKVFIGSRNRRLPHAHSDSAAPLVPSFIMAS